MKNALIAGASGLVGAHLLDLLAGSSDYQTIHVFTRKTLYTNSLKVVEHLVNFDELLTMKFDFPVDHVFCTLGTTIKKAGTKSNFRKVDYDYIITLAKKAKEMNAEKFLVVSSLGANSKSMIFYNRVKGEVEAELKNQFMPHLYIFRPSLLLGQRAEKRTGEKAAAYFYMVLAPLFSGPLRKYKGIEAKKVASAMIQTALTNTESFKIMESDEMQNY
jgi:uncharacterized protein YbjT (DUF2867 family)